jgi:hypothetical protein
MSLSELFVKWTSSEAVIFSWEEKLELRVKLEDFLC